MNVLSSFFSRRKSSTSLSSKDDSRNTSPIPDKEKEDSKNPGSPTTNVIGVKNRLEKQCSLEQLAKTYDLSDETLANYKEAFRMFDRNNDGSITTNELGSVMRSLGCQPTIFELRRLIHQCDEDGNGTIEFAEFVGLMIEAMQKHTEDDDLKKAFEVFDRDNDGYVSVNDLKLVIRRMGERLSDVELTEMINEADKDGDGRVNFDEFHSMWKSNEEEKFRAAAAEKRECVNVD